MSDKKSRAMQTTSSTFGIGIFSQRNLHSLVRALVLANLAFRKIFPVVIHLIWQCSWSIFFALVNRTSVTSLRNRDIWSPGASKMKLQVARSTPFASSKNRNGECRRWYPSFPNAMDLWQYGSLVNIKVDEQQVRIKRGWSFPHL